MHPTANLLADLQSRRTGIAVIGLGYVGLPLAICLARHFRVVGLDRDQRKIAALRGGRDPVGECGDDAVAARVADGSFSATDDGAALRSCRFVIVAVPTPVDQAKRPDFAPLVGASTVAGRNLAPGTVIVYESTVYPGATEEVCIPVVERESGRKAGVDFAFGYSPERINPGDREHTVEKIRKVVSGSDAETCAVVAAVYGTAITAGVFPAASVKVAEAAKVIENTQRDLNIALMNELAFIFHRIGIDTADVLAAARTKWNFLPFTPGLVGGHCIGVDPYYLTHKAQELGYHPEVILAGRRINDGMGAWVAQECIRLLANQGRPIKGARVLILGLTFKEDCPDVRNTRVVDIIAELRRFGCLPLVCDPVADAAEAHHEYGVELQPHDPLPRCDAIIAAVAHRQFRALPAQALAAACPGGPLLDVKACCDRAALAGAGLEVWRL
ncbi:MAG: nucleotide sugar dehydrogenase [Planctomycetes bacterium]|nr:nucleotide sugar dehydrogenase [Planctomycetota bacterium]